MKVVLAEKPSVARDIAKELHATGSKDGYLEGNGYIVTWAFGHLIGLKEPDGYDPAYKRWNLDDLPIIPQKFELMPTGDAGARNKGVHDLMRAQEVAVIAPLLDYLAKRNDVRLIGPREAARRAPTLAIELDRVAEPVSEELGRNGIACWAGDFYAVRPLAALGIDRAKGVLRMSATHYTSAEDVARLIAALDRVL